MRPELPGGIKEKLAILHQKAANGERYCIEQHNRDDWGVVHCMIERLMGDGKP